MDFTGTWKDNNSTFTLYQNGLIKIKWDNGQSATGTWWAANGNINFNFSKNPQNIYKGNDYYLIVSYTHDIPKYKTNNAPKPSVEYTAIKISEY